MRMLPPWTASRLASALRGNPEASRAGWLYAAAMDGSTNLSAIEEMRKALLRRTCSPLPNSSVVRELGTMRTHYKLHSRPQTSCSYGGGRSEAKPRAKSQQKAAFIRYNN